MTKLFLGFSDEVVPCSSVIGGAGQALRHDWPLLPCRVSCRGPPQNEGHQVQGHHRPFPCRERPERRWKVSQDSGMEREREPAETEWPQPQEEGEREWKRPDKKQSTMVRDRDTPGSKDMNG